MLLVVTNSVFDSTEQGVQQTFVSSFSGDIVIRPEYKSPLSLFGDETPVTGKHTVLPTVIPYDKIINFLNSQENITYSVPQVTGLTAVSSDENHSNNAAYIFGIPVKKYLECMSSIKITEGSPWNEGEKGVLLSIKMAQKLKVGVGSTVQFIVSEGFSSKIRAAPVVGIYEYLVDNPVMDKIVLVNPELTRDIMGMSDLTLDSDVKVSDEIEELLTDFDMDLLFEQAEDLSQGIISDEFLEDLSAPQTNLQEIEETLGADSASSWNFIICRAENSKKVASLIRRLNKEFKKNEWPVQAVNWRSSAGSTAFYLYILRFILNIGIIIVLFAGFIVVNNTLVINVLDRIREIGTMRAIGANKRYITKECMAETLSMAVIAGILGCFLGVIFSYVISKSGISFSNSFLIQLFGSNTLHTTVNFSNIALSFSVALVLGLVAWIYPVINALQVNPVQAMQGAK